jgi:hypothetical protein
MTELSPITPLDDLAQPWLSDNYTVREIRAAGAMAVSPSEAEQAFATPWSSSTTNSSPITPPPELVQQWLCSDDYLWGPLEQKSITITANRLQNVATQAAQWGADQELEACVNWLDDTDCEDPQEVAQRLRATRRPKPPSLKEQALAELEKVDMLWDTTEFNQDTLDSLDTIRRALEALDD